MMDPNARLLLFLKRLGDTAPAYKLAHLHVSSLPPAKKSRENISRAITILSGMKTKYKNGEVFLLKNLDIIFVSATISKPMIAAVCDMVRQSFIGQLEVNFTNIHGGVGEFFTVFELSTQFDTILSFAESISGMAEVATVDSATGAANHDDAPRPPVDLATLARIKEGLARLDVTTMLCSQPIFGLQAAGKATVAWYEYYVSIPALEEAFCPGQSLTANKWMFRDLTADMDALVLRLLAESDERGARRRISLNVNIATLASSKFINFDAELPIENRNGVVLEISITDVAENLALYMELLPFLRERGYRLLIDGLSLAHVNVLDLESVSCDFVKLFWSGQASAYQEALPAGLAGKIRGRPQPLVVLARCDTAESLRFARSMNIHMVQGRLIDRMAKKSIPM